MSPPLLFNKIFQYLFIKLLTPQAVELLPLTPEKMILASVGTWCIIISDVIFLFSFLFFIIEKVKKWVCVWKLVYCNYYYKMIFKICFPIPLCNSCYSPWSYIFACGNHTSSAKKSYNKTIRIGTTTVLLSSTGVCDGPVRVFSQIDKVCTCQPNLRRNTQDYIEKIPKLIWKAVLSNFSVLLWREIIWFILKFW